MARSESRILDEYLVASARAGDGRAFRLLAERWQKKLLGHAFRLTRDPEAARDSVQEAWVEIVRGIARLEDERAFPAWAHRIVSRRCARHIAAAIRGRALSERILAEPPPPASAHEEASAGPDGDRLRAALRALPPEQSAAVALFHLEDMSVAEVAVALDVPVGTVKTRLMHARRKLRLALEGEG